MTRTILSVLAIVAVVPSFGETLRLRVADYRDKMAGAWLGQSVGVAYGEKSEFKFCGKLVDESYLPEWKPDLVNGTFHQDDLYVEMTFLDALDRRGIDVTARAAGIDFANSTYRLWCANDRARNNLRRGIPPLLSSHPVNHDSPDDIDYQIEADFSGILAPGMPRRVLRFGETFGRITNYGDGLYAGEFIGGLYASAYFENDRPKVVENALACIPAGSKYATMVRDVLAWHRADPGDWQAAWRQIVDKYGEGGKMTGKASWPRIDAKLNGAMVLLGYLWGDGDIEKTAMIATRGGYDSDCNPSSALGVLGVQLGAKALLGKHAAGLDRTRTWENTDYTYDKLLAVCERLTRRIVVAEGGRIEGTGADEAFVIVPKPAVPGAAEDSLCPGPAPAIAPYDAQEMAQIKYAPTSAMGAPSVLKQRLAFDSTSLVIDGERKFLISGEFHYFRVPKQDWRKRLELLKAAGGNCVATYVPWCLHEEKEGDIRFGDVPQRDLDGFLCLVREMGLLAIVRPGPYQYSELVYDGLPHWLIEGHPEILKKRPDGSLVGPSSVDYNHPYFLEKTRHYFRVLASLLRPHLAAYGGPIALVQLDNELTGIHVWYGYPRSAAYFEDCAKYLATLRGYLEENGITGPYCHNAGGAAMSAYYEPCVRALGTKDFLLGYDHYYGLSPGNEESPTPTYFRTALFACDVMRSFGYPPVGFEIQCGTIGEIPPVLKEDALACYMLNLAAGLKGINYYVFTGGPNPPGMGNTCDIYDYHAPVAADGTVRPTYDALKTFGVFVAAHPELVAARRETAVRIGAEWRHFAGCAAADLGFLKDGVHYALMQTPYHPEYFLIGDAIPQDGKPLVLAGLTTMSAVAQRRVADFVAAGGSLFVAPDFPRKDFDGKPCAILADELGAGAIAPSSWSVAAKPAIEIAGERLFGYAPKFERGADGLTASWRVGKGRVRWFGCTWQQRYAAQARLVGRFAAELGAKPIVASSNINVLTTAYRLGDGKLGVFVLNLRPAPQETTLTTPNGVPLRVALPPMTVEYKELSEKVKVKK